MYLNELYFLLHSCLLVLFVLLALRMGKTCTASVCSILFVCANLFVTKQITLFGLTVTASDAYVVAGVFTLNLMQEYFGKDVARKQLHLNVLISVLFVCATQLHLLYHPSPYDMTQRAFQQICGSSLRIFSFSLIISYVVQKIDVELFALLRTSPLLHSPIRASAVSLLFSQFIDTTLFTCFALYDKIHSISHVVLLSYSIKVIAIVCMVPFTKITKPLLGK